MKKIVALFSALIIFTSLFAGCGSTEKNAAVNSSGDSTKAAAGSTASATETAKKFDGKVVVFATNWIIKENDRAKEYSQITKEKLGFDLEVINPPFAEASEKLNVMLSSGEQIDVIWKSTPSDMLSLAEKGYLIPVEDYLKNSKEMTADKWLGWDYMDPVKYDGKAYAVPLMKASGYIPTINKAWLDELGLQVPKTFEELNNVLVKFKEAKLGGDATIPMAHQWSYGDHVASFLGMWGLTSPNPQLDSNGKRYHPWLTPEAAEGFKWLQDMYAKGILDKEFPTVQEEPMRQKVINGMVGFFMDWPGANYDMNAKAKAAGKKSEMVAMEQVAAKSGITPVTPGNTICMWMISKTSKNPDAAFALIEYWNTEEGAKNFSLKEGMDYKVVDGKKVGDPTNGNFITEVSKTGTLVKAIQAIGLDPTEEGIAGAAVLDKQIQFPAPLPNATVAHDIARPLALKCITGGMSVEDFQKELASSLKAKDLID